MSQTLQGANALTFAANSGAFAAAVANFTNAALINYAIHGRFYSRAIVASQPLVIEPNTGIVPTAPNTLQVVPAGKACGTIGWPDAQTFADTCALFAGGIVSLHVDDTGARLVGVEG